MTTEPGTEQVAAWMESVILKRIEEDKLVLPSLPLVTMACVELVRRDDYNVKQLTRVVAKEPLLVARVLRAASSAGVGPPIKLDLSEALVRVGTKNLRAIFFEAAASKVVLSKDPRVAAIARRTWEHSVAVATVARDLAALSGSTTSEADYLGGLLHDLGKPIVAAMLLEAERQVVEFRSQKFIAAPVWTAVINRVHRKVGVAAAEKWKLPAEICKCVRDCSEYNNAERGSIVNSVCLANALTKLHDLGTDTPDVDELNALLMIGRSIVGVTDEVLKKMALELPERITGLFE